MAIVARIPSGFPIASSTTWSTQTVTINADTSLAAGDILLVFCSSEGTATSSAGICPDPVAITGITTTLNGGLHPTSFTVSNALVSSGSDLSSNALSRWLDLGYTAGGYDNGGSPGRNHGDIWGKVLVADDIASSGSQVSVTITLDQSRNAMARLLVVSGASTDDADLATLVNIARTSMGNTRSTSGTAYDEAEWWGPNATSQTGAPNPDPESNHHTGITAVASSAISFTASSSEIAVPDGSVFTAGRVISVSGSGDTNDGLYVITSIASNDLTVAAMGGNAAVVDESSGPAITITSGGYSTGDLGDDFLAMFFTQTPPETLPDPTSAPVATGTTRPPSVQATHVVAGSWNVDGTYPAGWAIGFNRTTPPAHAQSCYWDLQTSFATFDGLWDGTSDSAGNPNRFAWDYDDVGSQSGENQLWAYGTHLLLLKEAPSGGAEITFASSTVGTSATAAALTPGRRLAAATAGTSAAAAALTEEAVAISLAAATAGTSTAAAAVTPGRGLASSTTGTSATAAAITPGILLAAATAGTSAATAALTEEAVAISLAAATAGTSAAAAAVTPGRGLASSTTGTSAAAADFTPGVLLAAATAGTSTAAAALTEEAVAISLAAATTGTSTAAAAVTPGRRLASSTAGTSAATAEISSGILLAAATAGTSAVTAALTEDAVAISLTAATAGTSAVTAAATPGRRLTAATAGTSAASAALTEDLVAVALAAATAGTTGASAALTPGRFVAAATAGTSAATAALTVGAGAITFAAATAGTSTAAAAVTPGRRLASSTAGTSAAAADFTPGVLLAAATAGTSAATAALTEEAVAITFAAATAGTSAAAAAVTPGRGLASSTAGTSTATAALTEEAVAISFEASIAGASTATAALTEDPVGVSFSAAVAGASTVAGAITPEVLEALMKLGARSLVANTKLSEQITYYPDGNLAAGRTIRAVVERMELDLSDYGDMASPTVDVELWLSTDSTVGVSAVNEGKDLADVVVIEGESAVRVRITEVVDHDPAMVHLMAVR